MGCMGRAVVEFVAPRPTRQSTTSTADDDSDCNGKEVRAATTTVWRTLGHCHPPNTLISTPTKQEGAVLQRTFFGKDGRPKVPLALSLGRGLGSIQGQRPTLQLFDDARSNGLELFLACGRGPELEELAAALLTKGQL
eukprot:15478468-Alexandrium_andersonii.AAC.1